MIDPRALQQHFNKVRQREQPRRQPIPTIQTSEPLTAIKAIPIIEPVVIEQVKPPVIEPKVIEPIQQPSVDTTELQKELLEVTQALATLKQALTQTPQIEPVTITIPVSVATVVTEIKEEQNVSIPKKVIEKETPYGYSTPESKEDIDPYNPYGYYSGPKF